MIPFEVEFDAPDEEPKPPSPKRETRIVTKPQRREVVHEPEADAEHHRLPVTIVPSMGPRRDLPHVDEDESHLISMCLLAPEEALPKCLEARIGPESFYAPNYGKIFQVQIDLFKHGKECDVAAVAQAMRAAGTLAAVGGFQYLAQASERVPTTVRLGSLISNVRQYALRREIIRVSTSAIEHSYNGIEPLELLADIETDFRRLSVPTAIRSPLQSITDFKVPQDGDRSILLANRYLNRGDGMVLVGTSGIGKSSLSIQLAVLWSLGRAAFGIRPNGPMRSLIVQSEDSDGDIAEMWASMAHVLKLNAAEMVQVKDRVKIVNERVLRGDAFMASLGRLVDLHNPDLVFVNPLQAFMDGDVTDSQDLGNFLRGGLNGLNNGRFGYVIVHHTTKPATGKDKAERLWHEVMYDMAGGAEIINWARAIMSLRPSTEEGQFNLVLAKRGRRAGVVKQVEQGAGVRFEPVTTLPLKHATGFIPGATVGLSKDLPIIFWESRAPDAKPEKEVRGRPSKIDFNDYKNLFPKSNEPGLGLSPLGRMLDANGTIPKQSLHSALKRWEEEGLVDAIRPDGQPTRYRLKAI